MLGKMDNFGPFHLFYTLSCGDTRWNENFNSILIENGYNIIWSTEDGIQDGSMEDIVEVEFEREGVRDIKKLKEFLAEVVDESLHEFIRNNILSQQEISLYDFKPFKRRL